MLQNTPLPAMPSASVDTWGPIMWKMLHIAGVHMGQRSKIDDVITTNQIKYIVDKLPRIIPCPDCQDHARTYIKSIPFLPDGKTGNSLRTYVATYIFEFHNAVRLRKGQPILVNTVDECQSLYRDQSITTFDDQTLATYFRLATKYQIIRGELYMQWITNFKGLRSRLHI